MVHLEKYHSGNNKLFLARLSLRKDIVVKIARNSAETIKINVV